MWVFLEGIDRTGKSTVAEIYRKKDFEVVHMSAPDKKYASTGYTGPSYCDDILEMYMKYDNQNVIFDRSIYGETVWPHVYGRQPMLSEEDIEMLQEFEDRNGVERILMIDTNVAAHWQRCVENKEPLNQNQFRLAAQLFNKMAHKYNFVPKELKDFVDVKAETNKSTSSSPQQEKTKSVGSSETNVSSDLASRIVQAAPEETELEKLEKANAIRDVLSKRLIKQKGGTFDKLEDDIKSFLKNQLANIFSEKPTKVSLSEDEIQVLKVFCQRLKEKEGKK